MKMNGHNAHFKLGFTHHFPVADMASPASIMANFVVKNHGQHVAVNIWPESHIQTCPKR